MDLKVLLALGALVLSSCGFAGASPVSVGPGIEVAHEEFRAVDQCLLEAGFEATEVHPRRQGTVGGHAWETDTWFTWRVASATATAGAMAACRDRFAPHRPKTDDELLEVYERWLAERECLVSLGYSPSQPPPFDEWLMDWRTTGPWMPIDGLGLDLTGGPIESLKEQCGLEMVD